MITKPDAPMGILEDITGRTQTSVAFYWIEGPSNGGSTVHDYRIYMNADGSDYSLIRSGITDTNFLIDTLTPGVVYGFKLQARNDFGLSDDSEEFLILCATVPNAPLAPITTGYLSDVIVQWTPPFNNGSPITSYRVFLQAKDTSYIEESFYCLSNEYMVEHSECVVPLDVLTQAPYNLVLGDSIYAKVMPINFYGDGQISTGGNGATVVLVPSAPVQLTNDGSITNAQQVGFFWSDGLSTGGREVLDYRVWYDQSLDEYVILEENVPTKDYTTTISLIQGQTYKFKV
jgi:hypothetical protein